MDILEFSVLFLFLVIILFLDENFYSMEGSFKTWYLFIQYTADKLINFGFFLALRTKVTIFVG